MRKVAISHPVPHPDPWASILPAIEAHPKPSLVKAWWFCVEKEVKTSFTPPEKYCRLVALRHDNKQFFGWYNQAPPQSAITNLVQLHNSWPSVCVPIAESSCSTPVAGATEGNRQTTDGYRFYTKFFPLDTIERGKNFSVVLWTKISRNGWKGYKQSAFLDVYTSMQSSVKREINLGSVFHTSTEKELIEWVTFWKIKIVK